MKISETKIRFNQIQFTVLIIAAVCFWAIFVASAFFDLETAWPVIPGIVLAKVLFPYLGGKAQ